MQAKKYRKKPVVIEAMQYTGDNLMDDLMALMRFTEGMVVPAIPGRGGGWQGLDAGDWIAKSKNGTFFHLDSTIFELTYDEMVLRKPRKPRKAKTNEDR